MLTSFIFYNLTTRVCYLWCCLKHGILQVIAKKSRRQKDEALLWWCVKWLWCGKKTIRLSMPLYITGRVTVVDEQCFQKSFIMVLIFLEITLKILLMLILAELPWELHLGYAACSGIQIVHVMKMAQVRSQEVWGAARHERCPPLATGREEKQEAVTCWPWHQAVEISFIRKLLGWFQLMAKWKVWR